MRVFRVFGCLGNHHAIDPDIGAFLWHGIGKILIEVDGILRVTGPNDAEDAFPRHHFVLRFIDLIGLDNAILLLLDQKILRRVEFQRITRVHRIAKILQRQPEAVADGIQHEYFAFVSFIKQYSPAVDGAVDTGGVVQDANRSPHIGHGILMVRIIGWVLQPFKRARRVRNEGHIQFQQQILLDQTLDHIV